MVLTIFEHFLKSDLLKDISMTAMCMIDLAKRITISHRNQLTLVSKQNFFSSFEVFFITFFFFNFWVLVVVSDISSSFLYFAWLYYAIFIYSLPALFRIHKKNMFWKWSRTFSVFPTYPEATTNETFCKKSCS